MSEVAPLRSIAFIGLGNMGSRMARRLVEGGYHVAGYDLADDARSSLAKVGGVVAASAAEAVAAADVVVLMLPDSDAVENVLTDEAVHDALVPGMLVVDMSSSEPDRTRALAAALSGRGVELVDAPVSGGVQRAESGQLAIMVGGEATALLRLRPVLAVFGHTYHAGAVGAGHAIKALNNLMSATHLLVTSEVMLAGQRFGLDPAIMLDIFNASSGRSGSTENKWPNFILTESFDSGFGLRLMLKDMRIALRLAEALHTPSGLADCAERYWSRAAEALPSTADHTEIARWLRDGSRLASAKEDS